MGVSAKVDLLFERVTVGVSFTFVSDALTVGVKGFIFPAAFGLGVVGLASADLCSILGALLTLLLVITGLEGSGFLGFSLKVPLGCRIKSLGVMTLMIPEEFVLSFFPVLQPVAKTIRTLTAMIAKSFQSKGLSISILILSSRCGGISEIESY